MDHVELHLHKKKLFVCKLYNTFFTRMKGLMFSTPLSPKEGVLLSFPTERVIDIHMLFVFFPLDVLWFSGSGKIVKIERHVRPFATYIKGTRAQSVLEVPAGAAKNLKVGDLFIIKLKREDA